MSLDGTYSREGLNNFLDFISLVLCHFITIKFISSRVYVYHVPLAARGNNYISVIFIISVLTILLDFTSLVCVILLVCHEKNWSPLK